MIDSDCEPSADRSDGEPCGAGENATAAGGGHPRSQWRGIRTLWRELGWSLPQDSELYWAGPEARRLDWPENGFFHSEIPGTDRDAVILLGTEPNLRWKSFSQLVLGLAQDLEVERVVTFGSLLADVPHTRPAPVTAAATDPELMEELGLEPSRYEGPTGIVGVLLDACRQAGISSLSLWAAVPHYVSLAPSPRAALALVRRFGELMQIDVDVKELQQAADDYSEQVSEAVSSDADTAAYVEELERRVDMLSAEEELPSGDSLAAELTRFLRERDEQDEQDQGAEGPAS